MAVLAVVAAFVLRWAIGLVAGALPPYVMFYPAVALVVSDPRTELVKSYGVQAYACHPMIVQGQVLGTLSFGARTRTHFSEDDLVLMKAVADHVAIAVQRKQLEKAAEDELEMTELLLDAARALSDRTDLIAMLCTLGDVVLESVLHSRVTISLWDAERRELQTAASAGTLALPATVLRWDQIPAAARQAFEEGRTVVADREMLDDYPDDTAVKQNDRRALLVPLLHGERLLGLVTIDDPGESLDFTQREITVTEGIAAQAAAIDGALLYEAQRCTMPLSPSPGV